ncbi:MAG: hypothetical protein IOC86_07890 [Aestuariivirga sp.]|nr:hypothetical protein [Aestuariivirga sp.]
MVGNAPLGVDFSDLVDNSAVVYRINDCKNYDGLSGQKTDIVLINNLGDSVPRYLVEKPFLNKEICAKSEKFVIVRDHEVHRQFLISTNQQRFLPMIEDQTTSIILENKIPLNKVVRYSGKFNLRVFNTLLDVRAKERISDELFIMPSTGMFAILHALTRWRSHGFEINLIGFAFSGWGGHPWSCEKKLCSDLHDGNHVVWHRTARPDEDAPGAA